MAQQVDRRRTRAPNHFIITTLPPRDNANSPTSIPDRNTRIRTLASDLGLHLIDLSNHVSDDNGATWRSPSLNIGDGIHYTEDGAWLDGRPDRGLDGFEDALSGRALTAGCSPGHRW